ncbi:hypothetical protein EAI_10877 [Harpegnathos saltator]|uniref:Uncharacterized protein n=1 Tax=Harpegnathos saltator TaxID=610380 RepID=E2B5W3_HARSA|nr:hypothetical protein EAI_10877 [Harpegnathos saltator]
MIVHEAKGSALAGAVVLIGITGTVDADTDQTVGRSERHEKSKLEFRVAEDDVGQNEKDMLEREKRRDTGGGKRIQERNREERVAPKEYLLPSSPPLTHRFTA